MGKVRLTSETEFLYDERRSRTESVYVLRSFVLPLGFRLDLTSGVLEKAKS